MTGSIAKVMMLSVALTLAVPESYAKRVGGGRSVGRATPPSAMRQRSAPPQRAPSLPPQSSRAPAGPTGPASPVTPAAPVRRTQPDVARQSVPAAPVPPVNRTIPRQASSPWGGMLGGALIGLGLGSLIGANHQRDPAQQPPVQSEGGNGDEAAAENNSGTTNSATNGDPSPAGSAQMVPAEQPASRFGSVLLVGLAGLAIYFMMRRRRSRQRGF
jgi:MYXO-CTERM domain-containing protein